MQINRSAMQLIDKATEDKSLATFLFILSSGIGFYFCYQLSLIDFYSTINIAFDLDQGWYIDSIARYHTEWEVKDLSESHRPFSLKHPFLYLNLIFAKPLQFLGLSSLLSAIIVSQAYIGGSVAALYYCCRQIELNRLNAVLLAIAVWGTSTFQVNYQVLDSYSIAQFWLFSAFLYTLHQIKQDSYNTTWLKALIYVMMIGTTSYLLLFVTLIELCLLLHFYNPRNVKQILTLLIKLGVRVATLAIALSVVIYYETLLMLMSDPLKMLQRTLWAVARPGEKTELLDIATTFFAFSFFAPVPTFIEIDDPARMVDFRNPDLSMAAYIGLTIIAGCCFVALKKHNQTLISIILCWLVINLAFHMVYQDRGSLFLYSGHILPSLCVLLTLGIKECNPIVQTIICAMLTALLFINNMGIHSLIIETMSYHNPRY